MLIAMSTAGISEPHELTIEEWAALDEDVEGELVDGQLVPEEEVGGVHELVVSWLTGVLFAWALPRGASVSGSNAKLALDARRGRKPDLSVMFAGRKIPRHGAIHLPPDIAVEVLSERPRDVRRDRLEKMIEYARFGVRYYWIVDPYTRVVHIYELGIDGRYTVAAAGGDGAIEVVPGCEGLALDLGALWRWVDERIDEPGEPR